MTRCQAFFYCGLCAYAVPWRQLKFCGNHQLYVIVLVLQCINIGIAVLYIVLSLSYINEKMWQFCKFFTLVYLPFLRHSIQICFKFLLLKQMLIKQSICKVFCEKCKKKIFWHIWETQAYNFYWLRRKDWYKMYKIFCWYFNNVQFFQLSKWKILLKGKKLGFVYWIRDWRENSAKRRKTVLFVVSESFSSSGSFKHSNLHRHQRTQHSETFGKPVEYFNRLIPESKEKKTK
jgi:hypothetical protein